MDSLLPIKKDISIAKIIENNFTDVGGILSSEEQNYIANQLVQHLTLIEKTNHKEFKDTTHKLGYFLSNHYNTDIFVHLQKSNFTKYFEDYHDFQKYEEIIDVNKMHTLQDFTKYSNDFIEKYLDNKIENKEFSYIDRVFIKIQSNLGSDIKSKIRDYLLQDKENTLHYQNLVLGNISSLIERDPEFYGGVLDAFRLSLEKYKEFYDYNPKNPPLFEQFEKEIGLIDWDDINDVTEQETIDHYTHECGYEYDSTTQIFRDGDDEYSLEELRSQLIESNFECSDYSISDMYDINDEDNFSTESDGRSNKQTILIANYSEDTYDDVLDNNICYNDDVFSLNHGKDIFKDFIKKVYGDGNITGESSKITLDTLRVFLNQSLQSYYTPEEYIDEWINFDSLEVTQKEILKELGYLGNNDVWNYDTINIVTMIEKIFDYDIEDVLSTYEYELESLIIHKDLFYDIRVIKDKVSYPQISLTPVSSGVLVDRDFLVSEIKNTLDYLIKNGNYSEVKDQYNHFLNNFGYNSEIVDCFINRGYGISLLHDNRISFDKLEKKDYEEINSKLFYKSPGYHKNGVTMSELKLPLYVKQNFLRVFEEKILKDGEIKFHEIDNDYFTTLIQWYSEEGKNPFLYFTQFLDKNNITFEYRENLLSKIPFDNNVKDYFLQEKTITQDFLNEYFNYHSGDEKVYGDFFLEYKKSHIEEFNSDTLNLLEQRYLRSIKNPEILSHIVQSKGSIDILLDSDYDLNVSSLVAILENTESIHPIRGIEKYMFMYHGLNIFQKNAFIQKVQFPSIGEEKYQNIRGRVLNKIMSYKSFLNIDKESFDSLFEQLSLSDGLILYYNADKLDSVSGYNYEGENHYQEILSQYFKEFIENKYESLELYIDKKVQSSVYSQLSAENLFHFNRDNVFHVLFMKKHIYMDDIITSNILRDKIWDNQAFQTRIFEFQNLVQDTTFLSEIIKNNPDIKYDIDVEIRYDFYSLLPKNIKDEILKKIGLQGYFDSNDTSIVKSLCVFAGDNEVLPSQKPMLNYSFFKQLPDFGKEKFLKDKGLDYIIKFLNEEQLEKIFLSKMSIEELLFQKNELKNIETIDYPKFYKSIISSIIARHKNNITASLPVFKLLVDNFPDSKDQVISFVITEYKKGLDLHFINTLNGFIPLSKDDVVKCIEASNIKNKDFYIAGIHKGNKDYLENVFRILQNAKNMEEDIDTSMLEFIQGGYKNSKLALRIQNENLHQFKKLPDGEGILNRLNSFEKVSLFETQNKDFDIQSIVGNLEQSLNNQYQYLFGYQGHTGIFNGLDQLKDFDYTGKNIEAIKVFDIALKSVGKTLQQTDKSIQLRLENGKVCKSIQELEKDANGFIDTLKSSQEKLKDILTFKDYMLNILSESDKKIVRKIKKDVLGKLINIQTQDEKEIELVGNILSQLSIPFDKIESLLFQQVSQSLDNLKNSPDFQINSTLFEEINFETLQDQKIKQISKVGFREIKDLDQKKAFGKCINEMNNILDLKKLYSNSSQEQENNFFIIYEKLLDQKKHDNFLLGISDYLEKDVDLGGILKSLQQENLKDDGLVGIRHYLETVSDLMEYFKNVKSSVISHLKDDFNNIDLKEIQENLKGNTYSLKLWDRDDVVTNLNQGHYTHCCISPGGVNGWSMPLYIMSNNFSIINLYDEEKQRIAGQVFTYIGKSHGDKHLVIDNVEINNNYSNDREIIKEKIIDYVKQYRDFIGGLHPVIKIGTSYNDISIDRENITAPSSVIGYDEFYTDSDSQVVFCE